MEEDIKQQPDIDDESVCKFCLESNGDLISPCRCNGGMKYVHRDCLNRWRIENRGRAFYRCEICHYEYKLSRVWWSKILSNDYFIALMSSVGLLTVGFGMGYGSSFLYNKLYYSMRYMPFHWPHRMQIAFHSMCWVGVPGLVSLLYDLFFNFQPPAIDFQVRRPRISPRIIPVFRVPFDSYSRQMNSDNNPNVQSHSEQKSNFNSNQRRIAPYEPSSSIVWITLGVGALGTFMRTYQWANTRAKSICSQLSDYIENVYD